MNAASEFDLGPLTWVKGEIDQALERAADALGQAEAAGDSTQIRFCHTHIHQVHGALSIVGLDGVTQITESLESLLAALEEGRLVLTGDIAGIITQAISAIRKYLDDLVAGEPNQPLRLLSLYQSLAAARGGAPCSPLDLFFPDLSQRPPKRAIPVAPLTADQFQSLLKSERARFQRGLLALLRHLGSPSEAVEHMRLALENIEATQDGAAARTFWWSALAFVESLNGQEACSTNADVRQLLGKIDSQIKRLAEGQKNVSERLMREVLYALAVTPNVTTGLVGEVRAVFGLDALVPQERADRDVNLPQQAALRKLRESLATAEELWNKFCTGSTTALSPFEQQAQVCASLTNESGQTDLKRLGQSFAALAAWLAESPQRQSDAVAMEMATAILLLQNAQENFSRLGMDFARQVDLMVARLYACIAGKPATSEEEVPLLDEMTRRAQERLLVGQVAREIQTNLAQVEQTLDAFFRNPGKEHDLSVLEAPLKQTAGALTMLGHLGAVAQLQSCVNDIQRFAEPGFVSTPEDFEALAHRLSQLGFFVEALQHGELEFDAFVRRLEAPKGSEAAEPAEVDHGFVSAAEAEAVAESEPAVVEAVQAEPPVQPAAVAEEDLIGTLPTLLSDAELSTFEAAEVWQSPEIESLDVPPLALTMPETDEPEIPAAAAVSAPQPEIDAELLEIFLEEAKEVLETVKQQYGILVNDPHCVEALTTIRRAAHTLKGSGRMVGLTDMGEAAWAVEQTLNMWLRQDMAVSPALLSMIADAQGLFSVWVDALAQGGVAPDASAVVATAEALRSQEAMPVLQAIDEPATVQQVELPVAVEEPAPAVAFEFPAAEIVESAPLEPESLETAVPEVFAVEFSDIEVSPQELSTPVDPVAEEPAEFAFEIGELEPAIADATEPSPEVALQVPVDQPELPVIDEVIGYEAQPSEVEVSRSTTPEPEIPQETLVSPTLYDIFCEEAKGHLQTLVSAYGEMEANPLVQTSFAMARAAHTLGGIAATVGLMPLHHLAIALEHALLRRDNSGRPDSIEGLETVRHAIMTLEAMFVGLQRQIAPEEQTQLVAALEDVFLVQAQPQEVEQPVVSAEPSSEPLELLVEQDLPPEPTPEAVQEAPAAEVVAPAAAVRRLQDELDEQLLPIFLEEAQDQLRELTVQLRLWREDLASDAQPHAIARLLHTFKGNARMAGAMNLGEFTHLLESRVEEILRVGAATPAFIDEIESGCDTMAQATERLRLGEPSMPEPAAPQAVEAVAAGGAAEVQVSATQAPAMDREQEGEQAAHRATVRVRADLIDRLVNEAGELSIARARIEGEMRSLKTSLLDLTENVIRLRRQLRDIEIQAEGQIQARVAQSHEGMGDFDPLELDRFTRFQELTRFMAESVNDVATVQQNLLKNLDDANAALVAQARLNRGLQQQLMGVRMMPFASQAERLFRIVRQTAKELGKRANFDIVGGHVELDRSVLDKMMAPLEHMLRNAVAHGIEGRDDRIAAGKREFGEITVSLAQEGNEIILSMADDGRGLDGDRIRARAEALGLLAPGEHASEAMLFDLIFRPGFSTAGEVSQLAGRGVGMDVVKTEVSELGGRIEILSQKGLGTTFRLYLPLTLAVTQTLLMRVGTQLYAVPSTMIEQVLELKDEALADVRARGEVEWQGNRYPFRFLPHLLGEVDAVPEAQRRYWVLLLRSGTQRVAVQVDELRGNQEVVVKNIGAQMARLIGIAGATVLGDGHVVLILNPVALAARAAAATLKSTAPPVAAPEALPVVTLPTVMVVDDSLTVRKITSRLLTREGYQVVLAKDGVDALEQLLEVTPDVVLSDIEMPRMDGFDLVRNIRADKRLANLPVIMITSRTAEKHRNYALEIGATNYLGKPYDEDELLALIAGYVKAKQVS